MGHLRKSMLKETSITYFIDFIPYVEKTKQAFNTNINIDKWKCTLINGRENFLHVKIELFWAKEGVLLLVRDIFPLIRMTLLRIFLHNLST